MKVTGFVLKSALICLVCPASAGTVTNDSDNGPGSLRAILAAATHSEIIGFAPSIDGATITLTSGPLAINGIQLTIDASALPSGITISGSDTSRIFSIAGNSAVTLKRLHLRNGREITSHGGGIYAVDSELNLESCTIRYCFTNYNGGGIYGHGLTGTVNRCLIAGNQAMSFGGGLYLINVDTLDVRSSQISGNKSPDGGGISDLGSHPSLSNCSIQGNSGGGIRNDFDSNPMLWNCIVWGNTASGSTVASKQVRNYTNSHPTITFSLIEGASGTASFNDGALVVWGAGNLDGTLASNAPDFVSPVSPTNAPNPSADLRVYTSSPVIDAGENGSGGTDLDLAGRSRIQDGTIDLGAYEGGYVSFAYLHPALNPTGDNNGNGMSNGFEYALGVDPGAPWDPAALPSVSRDGNRLLLTFTHRNNGIDITPLWLTSASLSPASWIPMIENVHFVRESSTTLSPGRDKVEFLLPDAEPHSGRQHHTSPRMPRDIETGRINGVLDVVNHPAGDSSKAFPHVGRDGNDVRLFRPGGEFLAFPECGAHPVSPTALEECILVDESMDREYPGYRKTPGHDAEGVVGMNHVGFEMMQEVTKLPATFAAGEWQQGSGRAGQAVDGGP